MSTTLPMNRFLLAGLVALLPAPAIAHPAWGVVVDSDGCVFYSDLTKVVRRAADGTEVRSRGVHAHALALAPDGTVVGEETEYLGADRYRHRIWQWGHGAMRFGGWNDGFGPTVGIHRLADGSIVRASCEGDACRILSDADTTSTVLHEAPPKSRIATMFATHEGRVVFVQDDAVFEIDGENTRIVGGLRPTRFGVHVDDCGAVFATSYGDAVVELMRDGVAEIVYTSTPPWAPSGVAVAKDGLWVLEFSTTNEARLVKAPMSIPECSANAREPRAEPP